MRRWLPFVQKFQERRRDREPQGAPPRADNCVRQSQHPSGRCGTIRVRERFTEQTSVLRQNGGASLLHARSLAGWTYLKERKKRGVGNPLTSGVFGDRDVAVDVALFATAGRVTATYLLCGELQT